MKKIFLLLAVAMLYVPGSRAVDVSATGSCGNGLEWTLGLEDSLSVEPGVPARTVLFKLGDNEEIVGYEYYLEQLQNQNRFACVVLDTITDNRSFIFNGKRITSSPGIENYWSNSGGRFHIQVDYANLSEDNGYIVEYEYRKMDESSGIIKSIYYINYKGIVGGPFENLYCESYTNKDHVYTPEKNYDYLYELAGKWYAHKNGKNKRIDIIEVKRRKGKDYININGKDIGEGHSYINNPLLTKSGIYAYVYGYDGKFYVNINGKTYGGYYGGSENSHLHLTESGTYAYKYIDNGKWYVNINEKAYGGYEEVWDLHLAENGSYTYLYNDNGKWYVNINGKVELYSESESESHLGSSMVIFFITDYHLNDEIDISTSDKEHSFYSSFKYEYVVIDGKRYCDSPAIQAWFDNKKNAFVWNAVEGRELVVYEFKLD
ncbi:hypothetical protein FACS1894181_12800 [Bacteroidia bacterium]|nr:hypothetical protein FACS1894181_12800 [Bacteroidia bacterium]